MVTRLSLSSLGAWFDWKQSWEFPANIVDYRHQATWAATATSGWPTPASSSPSGTAASW